MTGTQSALIYRIFNYQHTTPIQVEKWIKNRTAPSGLTCVSGCAGHRSGSHGGHGHGGHGGHLVGADVVGRGLCAKGGGHRGQVNTFLQT